MVIRIVLAALIGGALMFAGGFVNHELLNLTHRHVKTPKHESEFRTQIGQHVPDAGVYFYPPMPKGEKAKTEEAINAFKEDFKKGPNAMVISRPAEELTLLKLLMPEGATNIVAALLAAIIISMTRPSCGFVCRWILVVLIGVITWASVNASYYIWYNFPQDWVLDELYCALIEWGLAGIAIAAIVKPTDPMAARF